MFEKTSGYSTPAVQIREHREALTRVIAGAWRQRRMILAPLLFSPLVLLAAIVFPQNYIAKTLLLLQERGAARMIGTTEPGFDGMRDKQPAIEALLKSDLVLRSVAEQIYPDLSGRKGISKAVDELRRRVSVVSASSDFIEVRLEGPQAQGLGDRLQTLTSVLLETLMAQGGQATAPSLVLQRYNRAVQTAEADLLQARQRYAAAEHPPADTSGTSRALASEVGARPSQMQHLQDEIARAESRVNDSQAAYKQAEERYRKYSTQGTLGVLAAPEHILVVDPPSDPVSPKFSRGLIALAGLAALGLSGVVLALISELSDPTVRGLSDFEMIASAPVIARLPAQVNNGPRRANSTLSKKILYTLLATALTLLLVGTVREYVQGRAVGVILDLRP